MLSSSLRWSQQLSDHAAHRGVQASPTDDMLHSDGFVMACLHWTLCYMQGSHRTILRKTRQNLALACAGRQDQMPMQPETAGSTSSTGNTNSTDERKHRSKCGQTDRQTHRQTHRQTACECEAAQSKHDCYSRASMPDNHDHHLILQVLRIPDL